MSNTDDLGARIYPCNDCGKMRTKAEGGTTFTVCDECWDKNFGPSLTQPPSSELLSAAQAVVERWDSPAWKDLPHTGEFINRLRVALAHPKDQAPTVEAQAIGEQTPVAIKDSEVFTACETYADNYMIEGRITTSQKAMRLALKKFMEGRSPMSSEARDRAIEAIEEAQKRIEDMGASIDTGIHESELNDTYADLNDALSALRGESPGA